MVRGFFLSACVIFCASASSSYATLVTGTIQVYKGVTLLGYVSDSFDSQNSYTYTANAANALQVEIDPSTSEFEIQATNTPDSSPYFGAVGGSGGYYFQSNNWGYAYLAGTSSIAAGPPQSAVTSLQSLGYNAPAEATLWSHIGNVLTAQWVNSDSTQNATQIYYDPIVDYIGITGSLAQYNSEFGILRTRLRWSSPGLSRRRRFRNRPRSPYSAPCSGPVSCYSAGNLARSLASRISRSLVSARHPSTGRPQGDPGRRANPTCGDRGHRAPAADRGAPPCRPPPDRLDNNREVGGGRTPCLPWSGPEGSSRGEFRSGRLPASHFPTPSRRPMRSTGRPETHPRMAGLFQDDTSGGTTPDGSIPNGASYEPPPPPDGPGLFGDALPEVAPPPVHAAAYRVLARKYRPTTFDDLIGQESMVRILRNAFAIGRVAHAFMLTGVRGVGKTTTARIIARALNCVGPDGTGGPTADPCGMCDNCRAILNEREPDVFEMDAASRTGVDDVREIIEVSRSRPMKIRTKVFIIDEIHMLSRQAFNALLKTLEEPPPHVKFVFATTEIRKVPITVLSRCQRFDLRRVRVSELHGHFARIAGRRVCRSSPPRWT